MSYTPQDPADFAPGMRGNATAYSALIDNGNEAYYAYEPPIIDAVPREAFVAGITDTPGAAPLRGVFIRAPWVEDIGSDVSVLARVPDGATPDGRADGRIVAVAQGPVVATSFHPELTGDLRLHEYFLQLAR